MPPATAAQPVTPGAPSRPSVAAYTLEDIAQYTQQSYDAGRFAPRTKDDIREIAEDFYVSGTLPDIYYAPKWKKDGNGRLLRDNDGQPIRIQYTDAQREAHRKMGVAKAIIVIRYGAMLRVLPEAAIYSIYLIDNKPSPAAALMVGCALARPELCLSIVTIKSTADACTIRVHRRGQEPEDTEAKASEYSHLRGRQTWKDYPIDMLYARCASRAMRRKFPDLFSGVYCMEERSDMAAERSMPEPAKPSGHIEAILQMADMPDETAPEPERTSVVVPVVPVAAVTQAEPSVLTPAELKLLAEAQRYEGSIGDPITNPMNGRPRCLAIIRQASLPPDRIEFMIAEVERRIAEARKAAGGGP
jgi:hypothetical protein